MFAYHPVYNYATFTVYNGRLLLGGYSNALQAGRGQRLGKLYKDEESESSSVKKYVHSISSSTEKRIFVNRVKVIYKHVKIPGLYNFDADPISTPH